jgi:hypothetical protein
MKIKPLALWTGIRFLIPITLVIQFLIMPQLGSRLARVDSSSSSTSSLVNVPELTEKPFSPAIFWFGKVDQTNNYADVRLWYFKSDYLEIVLHIIDRRLWYDLDQNVPTLTGWDAVSIYLNLEGNVGSTPGPNSYIFELQLNNLRASYRGNGSAWIPKEIPFTVHTEWRGANGPNSGLDSEGWVAYFQIPFSSLGLPQAPPKGTVWGLGVKLHDRDNLDGSIFQETMAPNTPSTWGQLSFGQASFTQPIALPIDTVTIRQGLNGATVLDGEVGGHTTCGNNGENKWTDWGNTNYAGVTQFNIQNQWDIADWPCFSKLYITFPITSVPPGYTILSATLSMSLFGTAGGGDWGDPPDSYIEVFTITKDWNEANLTWNNAPLASENISGTWVPPIVGDYHWNVSKAVDQAYKAGMPLKLAIYSIDGEQHSGKYFYSSDSSDWNGEIRPTLRIVYGRICASPDISCYFAYLPYAVKK